MCYHCYICFHFYICKDLLGTNFDQNIDQKLILFAKRSRMKPTVFPFLLNKDKTFYNSLTPIRFFYRVLESIKINRNMCKQWVNLFGGKN